MLLPLAIVCALLALSIAKVTAGNSLSITNIANMHTFPAHGVVQALKPAELAIVIQHDAISNYMAAMTMPFKVKEPSLLASVRPGDEVLFQLHVTDTESWIDHIQKNGTRPLGTNTNHGTSSTAAMQPPLEKNPLLDYVFTNELDQAVRLSDYHGQALAITFFYTRCPLPDYCPRLSKNFQSASQILRATNAPANWHLISVTFDPEFDTPAMLQAYGAVYHYDPAHWSFWTGSQENLAKLAQASGVTYEPDSGTINHNFRTLIIDTAGRLQMIFPTSGDLSDQIAEQLVKAAAVK